MNPGGVVGRVWRSPKWRTVIVVFIVCKVAATLVAAFGIGMVDRGTDRLGMHPSADFGVLQMWFQWDSRHYEYLATEFDYLTPLTSQEQAMIDQAAQHERFNVPGSLHRFTFGPLYPVLAKVVSLPLLGNVPLAMLVVANVAFFLSLALCWDLAMAVVPFVSPRDATIALALLPTGFMLQAALTESTYLAFVLGCLVMAERRRWGWAAVLGAGAALTRSTGFFISATVLLIVLGQQRLRCDRGSLVAYARSLPALAAPPLAWFGFMVYCWAMTGDLFAYTHLQYSGWGVEGHPPTEWVEFLAHPLGAETLKAWLILAFLALIVVGVRVVSPGYTLYSILGLALPLTFGLWWQSTLRYLCVLFPSPSCSPAS